MKHNIALRRATRRHIHALCVLAGIACLASGGPAGASGFAIQEQSGSGLGNAFAGGAAIAEDAGTIYTNPAGMTRLPDWETSVAASLICPSIKFRNDDSQAAALQPLGGTGGDAAECSTVPVAYLSVPLSERWWAGFGVNAPFGLTTSYDDGWIGRFQALKSEVKTINLNPALAFRANEHLALGIGIDWQRIDAKLTSNVNYAGGFALGVEEAVAGGQVPPTAVPTLLAAASGLESAVRVKGHDDAWGWNAGALFTVDEQTRIGLAYRSRIDYGIRGSVDFTNPVLGPLPATLEPVGAAIAGGVDAQLADGPVRLALELPATANLSVFHQLSDRWQLMGDVQFTGWSSVRELRIVRPSDTVLSNTPESFRDTWRLSAGANFSMSDKWMLRGGLAYDQSPVRDAERTPRLPDDDRRWYSVGARYRFSPNLVADAAFCYIDVNGAGIRQAAGSIDANALIGGAYSSDITLLAVQVDYRFD